MQAVENCSPPPMFSSHRWATSFLSNKQLILEDDL
jgi:hypothetical protein